MIYLELFLNFLKIGLFTVGGGYAMIPLISDTVVGKGWMTQELLIDFIAIAESTPGPFAINIATFVGNQTGGILGAITAVGGLFIPSFVIIFLIYKISARFMQNRHVQGALTAVRPTVLALILNAFVTVALSAFLLTDTATGATSFSWFNLILFLVSFVLLRKAKKLHPILLILLAAGAGILFYGFIL